MTDDTYTPFQAEFLVADGIQMGFGTSVTADGADKALIIALLMLDEDNEEVSVLPVSLVGETGIDAFFDRVRDLGDLWEQWKNNPVAFKEREVEDSLGREVAEVMEEKGEVS